MTWDCHTPTPRLSPFSFAMNESIVITHSLEDDTRGLDLPFLNVPFDNDGTLVSEFPWSYPTENNVSCDHDRCSLNPVKREHLTPPPEDDIKPYTAPGNVSRHSRIPHQQLSYFKVLTPQQAFDMGFGLGTNLPVSSSPGQAMTQLASQPNSPGLADCCLTFPNATDNKVLRDTTSSEPSHHPSPSSSSLSSSSPRRQNRKSTTSATTPPDNNNNSDDVKQHREKNRVAARKCRQKAKRNVAALQKQERELSQRHRELLGHVGSLRDEVLDLKNEVLGHADCGSDVIQNYIANAARLQMG